MSAKQKKTYTLSLHVFRRDLRLIDNTALLAALDSSECVLPCFIFDERQVNEHDYFSKKAFLFMLQSLDALDQALQKEGGRLYFFIGNAEKLVAELLEKVPIQAVFMNRDYTPFSQERDSAMQRVCEEKCVDYHVYADALLHEPEEVLKANGEPYSIFTPFYRRASTLFVSLPKVSLKHPVYYHAPCAMTADDALTRFISLTEEGSALKGGREAGLACLQTIKQLKDYQEVRNYPALDATTHLSPHHKFGTLSIREVHQAICRAWGSQHTLITELYWRDFFTHIAYHFPHVLKGAFHSRYDRLQWVHNDDYFEAWCVGKTGFPIVDAGMRELNTTGFMHNRVRMIVASFLTKDLLIDWRLGEAYFAKKLIDYDPAVNNGNWQWAASTGCDAQPYFRIFNPWLQQKKFDADCIYIKKWVPELSILSAAEIHQPLSMNRLLLRDYPAPIVDHAIQSAAAKHMYRVCH